MSFWDKIAPFYDLAESLNGKVYRKMLGYSVSLVKEGGRVLECAAGTGEISIAVSKKASYVLCTDVSEAMLERAKDKCRRKGIANIDFAERNIFSLPDEDESYDTVIAANVLHLVDEPEKAVKELMRVLKKGGRLLVPTFITTNPDGTAMTTIKLYRLLGFKPAEHYTPESYFEMLKRCTDGGKLRMKVIKGLIPSAYAVIEKPKEGSV
ncbi:MAG: class I SAM-dependent methyltransferase [Oscillospiraceae bacterium]